MNDFIIKLLRIVCNVKLYFSPEYIMSYIML